MRSCRSRTRASIASSLRLRTGSWGLRDYGTGEWTGGDADCDHRAHVGGPSVTSDTFRATEHPDRKTRQYGQTCGKCGATRQDRQLGLEETPEEYVENMVAVFRELRRVLAPHGTCWLNLGDSYAQDSKWGGSSSNKNELKQGYARPARRGLSGLKSKDLVGIPWRVAFALQADGWWLRSDVIWSKQNCMPESITDRPTVSHEYVFLLAKSGSDTYWTNDRRGVHTATRPKPEYWWRDPVTGGWSATEISGWRRMNAWRGRDYYFDQEAVREPHAGVKSWNVERSFGSDAGTPAADSHRSHLGRGIPWKPPTGEPDPDVLTLGDLPPEAPRGPDGRRKTVHDHASDNAHENHSQMGDGRDRWPNAGGRNLRTVWTIATQPYPGAHFATFPEALALRCVLASAPERVCEVCGKPSTRISERGVPARAVEPSSVDRYGTGEAGIHRKVGGQYQKWLDENPTETIGWTDCGHDSWRRGTVLDPFAGSGTTALVTRKHGRRAVAIELNPAYAELLHARNSQTSLFFEEETA